MIFLVSVNIVIVMILILNDLSNENVIPMTILHNHIQSEESVVIDNGKQTNFDR